MKWEHLSTGILLVTISLLPALSSADTTPTLTEEDYFGDIPVVLTATRLEQPITEAPVAITIIDHEMIENSGFQNIPDLLRLVPGFVVGYEDGANIGVAYHGRSRQHGRRMQVLIDDRSVYVPTFGGVPWQNLPINIHDIERIEVTRGPNAATHGANSYLAVISIITRQAVEDQGHRLGVVFGNHDTRDISYRFGGQQGAMDYRMSFTHRGNDGLESVNQDINDSVETDSFNYRLDFQLSNNDILSYQGGVAEGTQGSEEEVPHDRFQTTGYQFFKWEHNLSSGNHFSLQYYFNLHNVNDRFPIDPASNPPGEILFLNHDNRAVRQDLEFNYFLTPVETLKIVTGASARWDEVTAADFFDTPDTIATDMTRLFAHAEWEFIDNWLLNAGLMIEDNDIVGSAPQPRIALIHHYSDRNTFRAGVSQATRTPTIFENAANPILHTMAFGDLEFERHNGNLEPEKITSFELAWLGTPVRNLKVDVRLFHDRHERMIGTFRNDLNPIDLIELLVSGEMKGLIDETNLVDFEVSGIELSVDYRLKQSTRIIGNYSYAEAKHDSGVLLGTTTVTTPNGLGQTDLDTLFRRAQEYVESIPRHNLSLLVMNQSDLIDTSLGYYYISDYAWIDANSGAFNDGNRNIGGLHKLDLRFAKTFRENGRTINLALILQNLAEDFSDFDASSNSTPIQDKRIFLQLEVLLN